MGKKEHKSTPRGRDAVTGQFVPLEYARRHPKTTVVERTPLHKKGKK
jgi:hypothetical protein